MMHRSKVNQLVKIYAGLTLLLLVSCQKRVPINDISNPPPVQAEDQQYADVFKPLDGQWEGIFKIYLDTMPGEIQSDILEQPDRQHLELMSLKLSDTIVVEQTYHSSSPYFQTVSILDHYPGRNEKISSKGVNKVQNGKMWCVVHKPDETIIHQGRTEGQHTIIWHRNVPKPLSKEFFRETVLENTYEIVGWGYYGQADTTRMPPYWFYGKYYRK